MEPEVPEPLPAPRPRPFPCMGSPPGPRCGHTLTAINTSESDLGSAKLVLFGEHSNPIPPFCQLSLRKQRLSMDSRLLQL